MSRTELIILTSIILFVAFILGWVGSWVFNRMRQATTADLAELDMMASELARAEDERDQAISYLQQREAELTNTLSQTEAELHAAMEGLGEARREAADLRSYIERQNAG